MSLNALQLLVRDTLQGLETPAIDLPAAQCWIAPPVPGEIAVPQIYVWGAHFKETRQMMGRGIGGAKRLDYDLAIHLYAEMLSDDTTADSAFPLFIEAVLSALRRITMPQPLTDNVTGVVSQLVAVGEDFNVTYGVPRSLRDQRFLWYNCGVTMSATEIIIA